MTPDTPLKAQSAAHHSATLAAEAGQAQHRKRMRRALWVALVLVLIWGANFSVQKAVFNALSPGGFLFVRYLIMPLAAAVLLCARHGLLWPRVSRSDLVALLKLGLAGHLVHVSLVSYGIHWSTAFSSSLILACGPVFTLLLLRWHGIEHLARGQVVGVSVAGLGVLLFLSDKLSGGVTGGNWQAGLGDMTLLVAAWFFSYYTVTAKPLIERLGGVTVMTYATLLGSAPVVLLSLPAGLAVDWAQVSAAVWAGTLWAVLVSAFLGWMVWGWINAVRGVARSAPLMYLMPPVAGLVSWVLTGERFTAAKLGGAAIALAGVALAQFTSRSARDPVLDTVLEAVREAPAPVD
ncbi:MAG: DMT family transporter [Burkholderiaceae bacterium]